MEVFNQREDTWRRRLEREAERRRTLERQLKVAQETAADTRLNATLLTRRNIRMVPGKAHQRSHSHGGQQSLYGNQLFPQLGTAPSTAADGVVTSPVAGGGMFIVEERGPDFAEGGSEYTVSEEHFYDAIDAQIDKMHREWQKHCIRLAVIMSMCVCVCVVICPTQLHIVSQNSFFLT